MKEKSRETSLPALYRILKEADFELYRTAVESAAAIEINFNLPTEIALAVEKATIYCASKGRGLL